VDLNRRSAEAETLSKPYYRALHLNQQLRSIFSNDILERQTSVKHTLIECMTFLCTATLLHVTHIYPVQSLASFTFEVLVSAGESAAAFKIAFETRGGGCVSEMQVLWEKVRVLSPHILPKANLLASRRAMRRHVSHEYAEAGRFQGKI
jgi:hypothetical protein